MKKFEELISKRETEIASNKSHLKDDTKNHNEAVLYGILGAIGWGILAAFIGMIVGAIGEGLDRLITGDKFAVWPKILFWIILLIGIIGGYKSNYSEKRRE